MNCTRCSGTGFLNTHQLPDNIDGYDTDAVLLWAEKQPKESHDVCICDCCGDGDGWYDQPGEHDVANHRARTGHVPDCY